jgi:predicted transcriptional regulator
MSRSFRLTPELERRLEQAAACSGVSVSVFIREAVLERCDKVLGRSLLDDLGDGVGAFESGRVDSGKTGRAFAELLTENHRAHR